MLLGMATGANEINWHLLGDYSPNLQGLNVEEIIELDDRNKMPTRNVGLDCRVDSFLLVGHVSHEQ